MQESRIQAEYDDILREAILLRRDLEAEMQSCRAKQVSSPSPSCYTCSYRLGVCLLTGYLLSSMLCSFAYVLGQSQLCTDLPNVMRQLKFIKRCE